MRVKAGTAIGDSKAGTEAQRADRFGEEVCVASMRVYAGGNLPTIHYTKFVKVSTSSGC